MKVLANDGLVDAGVAVFEAAGIEVDTKKRGIEDLVKDVPTFDALLVQSATQVTREVIEAGEDRLKIVGRAGVGTDNVDVDAASEYGIVVKFAPHGNTIAAAEMAVGLMISISRYIPQSYELLKQGVWQRKRFQGQELTGKTLGIVGCGRIGKKTVDLVRGFDMNVLGYDTFPQDNPRITYVTLPELMREADYVSVHTSGESEIIGEEQLSMMKPTAYLINVARGKNVNHAALYNALQTRSIAGAGLDTFEFEPQEGEEFSNSLTELENVILTPHLGASTREARKKTGVEIAEVVLDYLLLGDWDNAINATKVDKEGISVHRLFITHHDVPGMFGAINKVLAENGINIRDNPSRIIGDYAQTVYLLHNQPTQETLKQLKEIKGVHFVRV